MQVTKFEPVGFTETSYPGSCPACGSNSVTHESDYPSNIEPFADWRVLYCTTCGTGFVPEVADALAEYYERQYSADNRRDRNTPPELYFSNAFRDKSPQLKRYFGRSARQIDLLNSFNVALDDVLDFGSGPGYFLFCCNPKRAYAFEPDLESRKYLDHIGATVFNSLEEIQPNTMDAIVSSHSLEHLPAESLVSTLKVLLAALKESGKLLIEVPHGGNSFIHHTEVRQDPHTIFFTPQGIVEAVRSAGGNVYFNYAAAKVPMALRSDRIYLPSGSKFFSERRGSLVLICGRQANSKDAFEQSREG